MENNYFKAYMSMTKHEFIVINPIKVMQDFYIENYKK